MQENKVYHFYYKNSFKKAAHYFVMWFVLFGIYAFLIFACMELFLYLTYNTNLSEVVISVILKIVFTCVLAFEIYAFVIYCMPRKIILTAKGIKIKRNSIQRLSGGLFNDYLKYETIQTCAMTDTSRPYFKSTIKISDVEMEHTVIVKTKLRRFVIPVEEAEDFVEKVNNRLEDFNN